MSLFKIVHKEIELFNHLNEQVGTPEETIRLEYLGCFEKANLKDEQQTLILHGVQADDFHDFLMHSVNLRLRRLGEIGTEIYDILEQKEEQ